MKHNVHDYFLMSVNFLIRHSPITPTQTTEKRQITHHDMQLEIKEISLERNAIKRNFLFISPPYTDLVSAVLMRNLMPVIILYNKPLA